MASDPERDIIPVKDSDEKYCTSSYRSSNRSNFSQSTSGHYAAKLDRDELENRYLRYIEENMTLKKHCHNQEEKIRRLAAKLLRLVSEQRSSQNKGSCPQKYSDLEVEEILGRVDELERSNQLLRDKLMVAGIQLSTLHPPRVTHKSPQRFGNRSSSNTDFTRVPSSSSGSRPVTSNTNVEITDQPSMPASSCPFMEQEVSKLRNQLLNYEKELETLREQSNARVQALEDELAHVQEEGSQMAAALAAASAAAHTSAMNLEQTSRRVAENVEIIKLNRNIKAQEEQILSLEAERRKIINDAQLMSSKSMNMQKEYFELKECLLNEKKKNSELQNEVQRLIMDNMALQDLKEEVKDLQEERSILQDTNNKLIQSIMEEGCKIEEGILQATKKKSEDDEGLSKREPVMRKRQENASKIEEDINRKEKEIEKRVKELEEELKIKLEKEKEAQIEKEKEKQKERVWKSKLEEMEMKLIIEASEQEKLKEQVRLLEVLLRTKELNIEKMEEDLKALNSLAGDLQSSNSKLTERLAVKNDEICNLLKIQKNSKEVTKIDSATQCEVEMKGIPLSEVKKTSENNNVSLPTTPKRCLLSKNGANESLKIEEEKEDENQILNEESASLLEWEQKLNVVSQDLENNKEELRKQIEINSENEKKVSKLENELVNALAKIDKLVLDLNESKLKLADDHRVKKRWDPLLLNLSKNLEEGMCTFDFYLDKVFLSEEGKASLTKMVGETSTIGLFLTWSFYEQESAYTAIFEGPDAQIDCMYSVTVPIADGLLEYLNKESLLIELHLAVDDISIPVAYCKISLKYCISFPKTSLNSSVAFITYAIENDSQENLRSSVKALTSDHDFGILQYQYAFNCPKEYILTYQEMVSRSAEIQECNCSNQELVDEEYGANEELKKKEEESSDIPEEQNILDENVLCPECAMETPEFPPKPAPRNLKPYIEESIDSDVEKLPQIVIEIHSLQLSPKSSVAKDPNIHQLFIEYTFLGKQGESMETPVSLPKPQSNEKLSFNFRKVFPMDPVENAKERNILKNVIFMRGSKRHKSSLLAEGKVRFNVVSEPLEDEDSDVECLDVGYAEISICQVLLSGEDIIERDIRVVNVDGSEEVIGYLNISFLAIDVLNNLRGHL